MQTEGQGTKDKGMQNWDTLQESGGMRDWSDAGQYRSDQEKKKRIVNIGAHAKIMVVAEHVVADPRT